MNTIGVKTWHELRDKLIARTGWIFRGQQRADWPLATSLERAVDPGDRIATEGNLQFKFSQAIDNYLPSGQRPENLLDWLAAMQHHGVPTRLLDFTYSPYVATYFAVEDAAPDDTCAVWAINEEWCRTRASAALMNSGAIKASEDLPLWIYSSPWPWTEASSVVVAGSIKMSARQIAQQAVFVFPAAVEQSFEDNLRQMAESQDDLFANVECLLFPSSVRAAVLRDMRLMNISRASLFPGLDGFGQSLKYQLVKDDPPTIPNGQPVRPLLEIPWVDVPLSSKEGGQQLSGRGSLLFNGMLLLPNVFYVVQILNGRVYGRVDINGQTIGMRLMTYPGITDPNADLVLQMEDGRVWRCKLIDNRGELRNRAGFEPPLGP